MKIQKQITVSEYRGYQLRHSSTSGHVTIYEETEVGKGVKFAGVVSDGGKPPRLRAFGWKRLVVRNSMDLARAYVDDQIARREFGV